MPGIPPPIKATVPLLVLAGYTNQAAPGAPLPSNQSAPWEACRLTRTRKDFQKAHLQYRASSCSTSHGRACCQSRRTASLGNPWIPPHRPGEHTHAHTHSSTSETREEKGGERRVNYPAALTTGWESLFPARRDWPFVTLRHVFLGTPEQSGTFLRISPVRICCVCVSVCACVCVCMECK